MPEEKAASGWAALAERAPARATWSLPNVLQDTGCKFSGSSDPCLCPADKVQRGNAQLHYTQTHDPTGTPEPGSSSFLSTATTSVLQDNDSARGQRPGGPRLRLPSWPLRLFSRLSCKALSDEQVFGATCTEPHRLHHRFIFSRLWSPEVPSQRLGVRNIGATSITTAILSTVGRARLAVQGLKLGWPHGRRGPQLPRDRSARSRARLAPTLPSPPGPTQRDVTPSLPSELTLHPNTAPQHRVCPRRKAGARPSPN